jgi:hypothetical protein
VDVPVLADVAWWWLLVAAAGGVLAFLPLVILAIVVGEGIGKLVSSRRRRRGRVEPSVAFAYYIDEAGLRSLAEGLRIKLPINRSVAHTRKFSAAVRDFGAGHERSETAEYAGIDLNWLADEIRSQAADGDVATHLGRAPRVQDEAVLAATIARLQNTVGETSPTRELLEALQRAYEAAKEEDRASQKRAELERVAQQGQLVILKGRFDTTPADSVNVLAKLSLVALEDVEEPSPGELADAMPLEDYYAYRHAAAMRARRVELPMPPGVCVDVTLPGQAAVTASGSEVLRRPGRFYGRAIAHSPRYDPPSGTLSCVAYAVWGVPTSVPSPPSRSARPLAILSETWDPSKLGDAGP